MRFQQTWSSLRWTSERAAALYLSPSLSFLLWLLHRINYRRVGGSRALDGQAPLPLPPHEPLTLTMANLGFSCHHQSMIVLIICLFLIFSVIDAFFLCAFHSYKSNCYVHLSISRHSFPCLAPHSLSTFRAGEMCHSLSTLLLVNPRGQRNSGRQNRDGTVLHGCNDVPDPLKYHFSSSK